MFTLRRVLLAALAMTLALAITGCSDNGEVSETTAPGGGSSDDVVFGSGELPETIPDGFPLPAGSSIGSTMVVTSTGFTEVIVRMSAERALAIAFFEQQLPAAGFAIVETADSDGTWAITFEVDDETGTIELTEPVENISQAIIRHNVP